MKITYFGHSSSYRLSGVIFIQAVCFFWMGAKLEMHLHFESELHKVLLNLPCKSAAWSILRPCWAAAVDAIAYSLSHFTFRKFSASCRRSIASCADLPCNADGNPILYCSARHLSYANVKHTTDEAPLSDEFQQIHNIGICLLFFRCRFEIYWFKKYVELVVHPLTDCMKRRYD